MTNERETPFGSLMPPGKDIRDYTSYELERFHQVTQVSIEQAQAELAELQEKARQLQMEYIRRRWGVVPGRTEISVKQTRGYGPKEQTRELVYLVTRVRLDNYLSSDGSLEKMYAPMTYGRKKLKQPKEDGRMYHEQENYLGVLGDHKILGDIDADTKV